MDGVSDVIRQKYIDRLGPRFGSYFYPLDQHVIRLVSLWDTYRAFFGANPERVALLNRASGYVALTFQNALYERIIIGVCQLTDPPQNRGNKNLTVKGLLAFIEDPPRAAEMKMLIDEAENATAFARPLRNKMLAHLDYEVNEDKASLDYPSRITISSAIKAIIAPMRLIHLEFFETTAFYHAIKPLPDELGFLTCIYYGVEEMEKKRIASSFEPLPEWLTIDHQEEFDQEWKA